MPTLPPEAGLPRSHYSAVGAVLAHIPEYLLHVPCGALRYGCPRADRAM